MASRAPKFACLFGKSTAEQVLKSFIGRNSSVKSPVFGLCDSLTPGLEESRVLRYLIRWVLWPSGQGAWFLNQGSYVRNHWVTSRSTQSFILLRLIKWVPGTSGNLVVQSKLPPWSGSSLEPVEPHPQKATIKAFLFFLFKNAKNICRIFFWRFWAAIMDLLTALKYKT